MVYPRPKAIANNLAVAQGLGQDPGHSAPNKKEVISRCLRSYFYCMCGMEVDKWSRDDGKEGKERELND